MSSSDTTFQVKVGGMHCQSCVATITNALKGIPGIRNTQVDLQSGLVTVQAEAGSVTESGIRDAIFNLGFDPE